MERDLRRGRVTISIVLPNRNGGATLPALLDAIARQRVDLPVELVAVDSGSTDGSDALLRKRANVFASIPAASFNHGLTRNLGIERSRGDLIVLTVDDALPQSDDWLARLVAPLRADDRIAGTFARQIPRPDASAVARRHLSRWVAASATPRTVTMTADEFAAMTPYERLDRCAFDDVCSCIRRTVWSAHPFPKIAIAEDLAWAKAVLLAGYKLAYVPDAVVSHSHDKSIRYEFDRTRMLHAELRRLFGLRTIPSLPDLARATASTIAEHARVQPSLRALALAVAWPLGQYLGARTVTP